MSLEQGNFDIKTADDLEDEIVPEKIDVAPVFDEKTLREERRKASYNPNEDPNFIRFANKRWENGPSREKEFGVPEKEKIYPDPFDDPAFKEVARIVIGEGGKQSEEQVIEQAIRGFIKTYPKKAKFYSFNPESAEVGRLLELEFTRKKLEGISYDGKKIEPLKPVLPMGYVPPNEKPKTFWGKTKSFFGSIFS
ncbi:MAG: hypothetical protein PHS53_02880 [Candidatus Pacebacteria bacterium]|nr:hypothetical protein [Candidatus Paceibacterota bacterium]MDD5357069.1 hypothetical protein [Candidatus Paceibacterota bacterium]